MTWRHLEVMERWNVARFLGALQIYGLHGKPLKKVSGLEVRVEREAVSVGGQLLLEGQEAFHNLLNRLRSVPPRNINVQLMDEAFPGLLMKMRRGLTERERESVLPYVRSYLERSVTEKVAVLWREGGTSDIRGAVRTANALGIRRDKVRPLLKQQGIHPKVRKSITGRQMIVLLDDDIRQVGRALSDALPRKDVARNFGISPARQDELIKAGMLRFIGRKVDRVSLDELFGKLFGICGSNAVVQKDKFISMPDALRTLVPCTLTASFIAALIAFRIPAVLWAQGRRPADSIMLSRTHVANFLEECRNRTSSYIAIPAAAHLLGLKQEVLYHLVNRQIIPTRTRRIGRRSSRFIEQAELERFRTNIETLADAAGRAGIGWRGALKWAQLEGLEFISGPSIDGGRQYFVRRVL